MWRFSSDPILAIDASPFAIRAVVTPGGPEVLDSVQAQPHEGVWFASWAQTQSRRYPGMRVVGSPLDEWPTGLEEALRAQGLQVNWLSPKLARGAFGQLAQWARKRRLHRARLLAFLAHGAEEFTYRSAAEPVLRWEHLAARETIDDVVFAAAKLGLRLDTTE